MNGAVAEGQNAVACCHSLACDFDNPCFCLTIFRRYDIGVIPNDQFIRALCQSRKLRNGNIRNSSSEICRIGNCNRNAAIFNGSHSITNLVRCNVVLRRLLRGDRHSILRLQTEVMIGHSQRERVRLGIREVECTGVHVGSRTSMLNRRRDSCQICTLGEIQLDRLSFLIDFCISCLIAYGDSKRPHAVIRRTAVDKNRPSGRKAVVCSTIGQIIWSDLVGESFTRNGTRNLDCLIPSLNFNYRIFQSVKIRTFRKQYSNGSAGSINGSDRPADGHFLDHRL